MRFLLKLDGQVSAIVLWNGSYSLSIDFPYSGIFGYIQTNRRRRAAIMVC